ncbi:MAG TPA: DUF4129 domain-containing protein [Chitinophagaceae bacterium]|nr:DUF4129 domain-containing protein [Chitinophagaceae bacterium]
MKKISSYRFLLLFALAFLNAFNSYNQETTDGADSLNQTVQAHDASVDDEGSYYPDTLKRDYRSIDYDSVQSINNDKGFYYKKYMDSLLRAIEARLKNMEEQRNRDSIRNSKSGQYGTGKLKRDTYFDDGIFSGSGLGFVFWILAIALFGYIVFKLFLSNASFFSGNRKNIPADIQVEAEENTNDPDALIRNAIRNGNYRLVVRYLYLQTLIRLSEKKIIRVNSNKTNYEYVKEVRNQKFANEFASLTLKYEYVWYGEYPVDEKLFEQIHGSFTQFNKSFLR